MANNIPLKLQLSFLQLKMQMQIEMAFIEMRLAKLESKQPVKNEASSSRSEKNTVSPVIENSGGSRDASVPRVAAAALACPPPTDPSSLVQTAGSAAPLLQSRSAAFPPLPSSLDPETPPNGTVFHCHLATSPCHLHQSTVLLPMTSTTRGDLAVTPLPAATHLHHLRLPATVPAARRPPPQPPDIAGKPHGPTEKLCVRPPWPPMAAPAVVSVRHRLPPSCAPPIRHPSPGRQWDPPPPYDRGKPNERGRRPSSYGRPRTTAAAVAACLRHPRRRRPRPRPSPGLPAGPRPPALPPSRRSVLLGTIVNANSAFGADCAIVPAQSKSIIGAPRRLQPDLPPVARSASFRLLDVRPAPPVAGSPSPSPPRRRRQWFPTHGSLPGLSSALRTVAFRSSHRTSRRRSSPRPDHSLHRPPRHRFPPLDPPEDRPSSSGTARQSRLAMPTSSLFSPARP